MSKRIDVNIRRISLKYEIKDFIEVFKPYRNGCKFKLIIKNERYYIGFGCYPVLLFPSDFIKYLCCQIESSENNEFEIKECVDYTFNIPELIFELLQLRCKHCGGAKYYINKPRIFKVKCTFKF